MWKKAEKLKKSFNLLQSDHQFLSSFVLYCFNPQLHGSKWRTIFFALFFLHYLFILIEKSNELKLLYNHVEHLFHSNSFRCSSSIVFQHRIFCCRLLRIRSSSRSVFYSRRSGFHLIIMIFQSFPILFLFLLLYLDSM